MKSRDKKAASPYKAKPMVEVGERLITDTSVAAAR